MKCNSIFTAEKKIVLQAHFFEKETFFLKMCCVFSFPRTACQRVDKIFCLFIKRKLTWLHCLKIPVELS